MILVTGCFGFLVSNLCNNLVKREKIVGLDLFDGKRNLEKEFTFVKSENFILARADISNTHDLRRVFKKYKFEKVVHLAAKSEPRSQKSKANSYVITNVIGTLNLLEECRKNRVKKVVFASTSNIYGLAKAPFNEEKTKCCQISAYAMTKLCGELLCKIYSTNYFIDIPCLRFSTVYGENGRKDMAVEKFTKSILSGRKIKKFGNGESKRDYLYVGDAVNAVLRSLELRLGFEIINIGSGRAISINELINLIEKETGRKAIVEIVPEPLENLPTNLLEISKAKRLLNWKPKVQIEDGIREICRKKVSRIVKKN
ncbi:MAG: NAD-dependent epimerase/dehydratase family protein [Candidatus Diapherotrites archaeon]